MKQWQWILIAVVWADFAQAAPVDSVLSSVVHIEPQGLEEKKDDNDHGSGFLIDSRGYLVTSAHVVPETVSKVRVTFSDRSWEESETIYRDSRTDLALIKLDEEVVKDVRPLTWGRSQTLKLGQPLWAAGSPFGFQGTLTRGILSAKNRILNLVTYEDFLQTDVAINPGNSGGPLVDEQGTVVGVVTAIQSSSGNNSGVSFAVSSRMAKHVVTQLMDTGKVERGYMGLKVTKGESRLGPYLEVTSVAKDSPSEKARLRTGDRIVSFLGEPVRTIAEIRREVSMLTPGTEIALVVVRGVERRDLTLVLGTLPKPAPATEKRVEKLGLKLAVLTDELAKSYGFETVPSSGLIVTEVFGPALSAGVQNGDVLTDVESSSVSDLASVETALEDRQSVVVRLERPKKGRQYRLIRLTE